MKKEDYDKIKSYKSSPEGSLNKKIYDSFFMSFQDYLNKYYSNLGKTREDCLETWNRWKEKYINSAFDKNRHQEMIKNFGYVSIDKHNFKKQYEVYKKLKSDERFDDELRKFIGFMAGNHFFERYNISLEEWMISDYWTNPYAKGKFPEMKGKHTIEEILNYKYGVNFLKCNLPLLPHWKR